MCNMRSIGIYAPEITEPIIKCIERLRDHFIYPDYELVVYNKGNFSNNNICNCFTEVNELKNPLLIISIGGDGTFIRAAQCISNSNIPLVGINYGKMGFLADISNDEIDQFAEKIKNNKFKIEERSFLEIESSKKIESPKILALNEVSITKKDSAHLMTIHSWINEEYLGAFWADGIIVATPTGSTAYSLSLGGSIIIPSAKSLIINTIAPHTLTVRPLIIPDDSVVTIKIEGRDQHYNLALDSIAESIEKDNIIKIKKSATVLKIIKIEGKNYFNTLRNKLMWGLDIRN